MQNKETTEQKEKMEDSKKASENEKKRRSVMYPDASFVANLVSSPNSTAY